jgi:hypothetical protein
MRQRGRLQKTILEWMGGTQPLFGNGLAWFPVPHQVPRKPTVTCTLARSPERGHLLGAPNGAVTVVAF